MGDGELVVSLKSLNHRGLDIQFHAPSAADPFENAIRAAGEGAHGARARGSTGVAAASCVERALRCLNHALLEEYLKAFREAADTHGLEAQPDLNAALRIPGMFADPAKPSPDESLEAVLTMRWMRRLTELNAFRDARRRGDRGGDAHA